MTKPKLHTYPNGLRVVYESPATKSPQTFIRAFCHVGSIHEPADLRGVAHFVEHMCFKGCQNFPSWEDVAEPFSEFGAYFNASTDKQYTVYKINCLYNHTHHFLRILSDMLFTSKFDKAEYKLELNVVKEEVKLSDDESYVEKLLFKGSPYEHFVDHDSYHKPGCLPYDKVLEFYHKYYTPQNMVLSIVSSIPFETILKHLSSTNFARVSHARRQTVEPILNPVPVMSIAAKCSSEYAFKPSEGKTTRIEIAVRICDQFNSSEFHTLNLLRQIVGESMSSRLFVELREKRGLTYRSSANMVLYEPAGLFVLSTTSDSTRILKDGSKPGVIPVMFDILEDLIRNGVSLEEVRHAKTRVRDSLKMSAIAGEDRCGYNGVRVMLHNDRDIIPNEKMYDQCYKSIDRDAVNAIIQKYFAPRQYYFSVIGGKLPKKEELARFLIK